VEVPQSTCGDGLDNDCDGGADCDDADCAGDPGCPSCLDRGAACTFDGDCCTNRCHHGACK
jgi:hypothetical protein